MRTEKRCDRQVANNLYLNRCQHIGRRSSTVEVIK